jgi:cytidylate kinase
MNTSERYEKYYKLDFQDKKHYDLVVDTTDLTPEQVVGRILRAVKRKQRG